MSYAGYAGKRLSSDKPSIPQCLLFLFFKKRNRTPSFLFRRKNGQHAREAQPLRRTDAGTSCVVVGRNTAAGMPPSSALSLPVSAAPARQLSRANRPRKRKSTAEQLSFCPSAIFPNALHKTDGSNANRLLFFLEEKKQKKVECGKAFFLCSRCFRQRVTQNGRFKCEPSVFSFRAGRAGKHLFSDKSTIPQCLLFLFFKKRNRPPLEEKKTSSFRRKEKRPLQRSSP